MNSTDKFYNEEAIIFPHLGDVIYVDRGFYKHYGVYVGNGHVVHFAGDQENELDPTKAYIQETDLADFLRGGNGFIDKSSDARYSPEEIVMRARAVVGEGKGLYNLVFRNCEHFARWCKSGIPESQQVNEVVEGLLSITDSVVSFAKGDKPSF